MPDRELTIESLEIVYHRMKQNFSWFEEAESLRDALALLREQEPVKPEFDSLDGNVGRWRCGNCHISIGAFRAPYCWHCGRAVKWGET